MSGPGAAGRLPTFLVIGAMKAATSSVAFWLGAHPGAWVHPDKEVHFFDRDRNWRRGPEWYRAQFGDAPAGVTMVGEATPSYLFEPGAPARMASVVPGARLLAILRHPVDRAWSHYWHQRFFGLEGLPFEQAIALEGEREAAGRGWDPHYVDRGRYLPQLRRVIEHYPREQLHVVVLDDLAADPSGTYRAVCRFLGLDDAVVPEIVGRRFNPFREHRFLRLWLLLFRYDAWRLLPSAAGRRLARAMWREGTPPPLPPGLRAGLVERFAADNAALAAWLGRDLPAAWSE